MDERTQLVLITDRRRSATPLPELLERALSLAPPATVAVQLREKDLMARPLAELARALLPICRKRGAPLLVNDRIDVALALGLDGVHLPSTSFEAADARRLLSNRLVGVSCHSVADIQRAREGRADYVLFGPLYDTPSKREFGEPLGLSLMPAAAAEKVPVFGVGGITIERVASVRAGGARGVAAIGVWMDASDPGRAVSDMLNAQ